MKKVYTFIMLLSFGSLTFVGCSSSKKADKGILSGSGVGTTVVKTVATIVGVILLSKLIKSVLGTVGGSNAFASLSQNGSNILANFNEDTKLSSFAKNDLLKTALTVLVAEKYQIPLTTVANSYSSLVTVGDLATFIGKNGSAKALLEIK